GLDPGRGRGESPVQRPEDQVPTEAGREGQDGCEEAQANQGGRSRECPPTLGGNAQIAKAGGDAPVQAYIAAMPGWKRGIGERIDALIARTVPGVRKAVKWNSPLYGVEGQDWFLGIRCFTKYVKVAFFRGASLLPVPQAGPGARTRATSTSTRTTSSTKRG